MTHEGVYPYCHKLKVNIKNSMSVNILIIEDDKDVGDMLKTLVGLENYRGVIAVNGNEAIGKLKIEIPDLIILDIMMPEMDGFSFLELIKSDDKYKDIPVIIFSARTDPKSKKRAFDLGAIDFLEKGKSHIRVIIQHINAVLKK